MTSKKEILMRDETGEAWLAENDPAPPKPKEDIFNHASRLTNAFGGAVLDLEAHAEQQRRALDDWNAGRRWNVLHLDSQPKTDSERLDAVHKLCANIEDAADAILGERELTSALVGMVLDLRREVEELKGLRPTPQQEQDEHFRDHVHADAWVPLTMAMRIVGLPDKQRQKYQRRCRQAWAGWTEKRDRSGNPSDAGVWHVWLPTFRERWNRK